MFHAKIGLPAVLVMQREGTNFDVAVIGGGPAGMMSAAIAAESGARVVLLEKNKQLGRKLLLTGGGKCNLTNAEFNLRKLVEKYGKGGEFLFHAFSVFGPKETIKFFEKLGVKTKTEKNNRVFPASEKAADVLSALEKYLSENKVDVYLGSPVLKIILDDKRISKVLAGDKEIIAKNYIICAGGKSYPITGSTGDGFEWAKALGHKTTEISPSLVPIRIKESWVKDLQGLSFKDVGISIASIGKKSLVERGDVMFTHFGLSGPAILDLSKEMGELFKEGEVKICLDFFPDLKLEILDGKIEEKVRENPKKLIKSFLADFMPQRLIPVFAGILKIDSNKQANNITKKERGSITKLLKKIEVTAVGLMGFELAMATRGGILLNEIDDKTMKSKIIDNLYFAGETINIDGKTGGFNLQACWSTGYLAGKNTGVI